MLWFRKKNPQEVDDAKQVRVTAEKELEETKTTLDEVNKIINEAKLIQLRDGYRLSRDIGRALGWHS
jgi:tetrahydromethanopterin S-methyltransferase subunit G